MNPYKSAYINLFNQITDTILALELEVNKLKQAQLAVEELIIACEFEYNDNINPKPL